MKLHKLQMKLVAMLLELSNKVLYRVIGRESRPVFYDVDKVNPALKQIDENWQVILEELKAVLPKQSEIPRYDEVDPSQEQLIKDSESGDGGVWRTLFIHLHKADLPTREMFPKTLKILESIPDCIQAWFSIMEAGQNIAPHRTRSYGYLRYHTGLIIPEEKPPKIRIKDQFHTWEAGKSMLFDNSWEHQVYNESKQDRIILITDILRPLPFFSNLLNRLTFWVVFCRFFTKDSISHIKGTLARVVD